MAATGGICGRDLPTGGVCHNPPGCAIRHKQRPKPANQARKQVSEPLQLGAALALATNVTKSRRWFPGLSRRRFEEYPPSVVEKVVKPLSANNSLVPPPLTGEPLVAAQQLLETMSLPANRHGFTLSTFPDSAGRLASPSVGHCVALPGSQYLLPANPVFDPDTGEPTPEAVTQVKMWVDHLEPLLENGNVWLGGWVWPSGEHKGKTEINVTVVFPADQTATANEAATAWNQHSYWTSDPDHPDGGTETETGGSGGKSIFNDGPIPPELSGRTPGPASTAETTAVTKDQIRDPSLI